MILGTRTDLLGARVIDGPVAGVHSSRWDGLAFIGNHSPDAVVVTRANTQEAVVEVQGVARFHITGRTVTIDAHPDTNDEAVRSWLYGSVAALVAGQAGRFALHASVIDINGVGVAITGRSGAGKSTTTLAATHTPVAATGLNDTRARLVADDVAVLTTEADVLVHPFGRPVHVWNPTAARLGIDVTGAPKVASGLDKVSLPAPLGDQPRPLHAMVVLSAADVDVPEVHPVDGLDRLRAVRTQTYRGHMMGVLWPQELFDWQAEVSRLLDVVRIVRPHTWSVDAVVSEVTALACRVRS